jgi:NAD-dependent SIR2 family protein deacetylase
MHTPRSLVKPDIVFYEEKLPTAFYQRRHEDLAQWVMWLRVAGIGQLAWPWHASLV